MIRLELQRSVVRSWRGEDAQSIAPHADNRKVWLNLRDAFPHPYTLADAEAWVRHNLEARPETNFAIEVGGAAVGSIGFRLHADVERIGAEIGYWLAEPLWGRGITTEALVAVTRHATEGHGLERVWAVPFAWNEASHRVLEKAGYRLEGRMRKSAIKDGRIVDQLLYAWTTP